MLTSNENKQDLRVDELLSDQVLFVRWSKISFLLAWCVTTPSLVLKVLKTKQERPSLSGCSMLKIVSWTELVYPPK